MCVYSRWGSEPNYSHYRGMTCCGAGGCGGNSYQSQPSCGGVYRQTHGCGGGC